jgi:hypothetical protein
MDVDYSYVEVSATTQEAMAKEDHDHPIESSGTVTHTLVAPDASAAPKVSAPTLVGLFLLSNAPNLNITSWS